MIFCWVELRLITLLLLYSSPDGYIHTTHTIILGIQVRCDSSLCCLSSCSKKKMVLICVSNTEPNVIMFTKSCTFSTIIRRFAQTVLYSYQPLEVYNNYSIFIAIHNLITTISVRYRHITIQRITFKKPTDSRTL